MGARLEGGGRKLGGGMRGKGGKIREPGSREVGGMRGEESEEGDAAAEGRWREDGREIKLKAMSFKRQERRLEDGTARRQGESFECGGGRQREREIQEEKSIEGKLRRREEKGE